jgi:hypothetical protein
MHKDCNTLHLQAGLVCHVTGYCSTDVIIIVHVLYPVHLSLFHNCPYSFSLYCVTLYKRLITSSSR